MTQAESIFLPGLSLTSVPRSRKDGFTLIEIMVAAIAASIILAAVYGIFYRAIKLRDSATERSRDARLRARTVNVIRNDLKNALISGGILAATLQGDSNGTDGGDEALPGYLKFTTTTGKDIIATTSVTGTSAQLYGDVQQVEYYISKDQSDAGSVNAGTLVRVVTRDLLDSTQTVTHEEQLLTGVQSFQVSFYDGTAWQASWQLSGTSTSGTSSSAVTSSGSASNAQPLPAAIRLDIQQASPESTPGVSRQTPKPVPAPLQILVPWVTTPFISGTNYTIGSGTVSPLPQE